MGFSRLIIYNRFLDWSQRRSLIILFGAVIYASIDHIIILFPVGLSTPYIFTVLVVLLPDFHRGLLLLRQLLRLLLWMEKLPDLFDCFFIKTIHRIFCSFSPLIIHDCECSFRTVGF